MTMLESIGQEEAPPTYLAAQLPVVMASDPALARFLRGLDEMASALYDRVGQKEHWFDIGLAPLPIVRLLADQIGVPIDPMLAESAQREIARTAAATFPIRGTSESLRRNLEALTGTHVVVHDSGTIGVERAARTRRPAALIDRGPWDPPVVPADDDRPESADVAVDTDEEGDEPVRIVVDDLGRATIDAVRATVRRELPAAIEFEIHPLPLETQEDPA